MKHIFSIITLAILAGCSSPPQPAAEAPPAPGTLAYDKSVFMELLASHEKITRTVTDIEGGIESTTESDDPVIAAHLRDHVHAMEGRLRESRRLRQWDPLYVAIFDNADKITMQVEPTPKGVRVRETSTDPHVTEIIRAHARVVSGFAAHGTEESAKEHAVPAKRE